MKIIALGYFWIKNRLIGLVFEVKILLGASTRNT